MIGVLEPEDPVNDALEREFELVPPTREVIVDLATLNIFEPVKRFKSAEDMLPTLVRVSATLAVLRLELAR